MPHALILALAFFSPISRPTIVSSNQAIMGPFSTYNNYAVDMAGTPDSRPSAYGSAASNQFVLHFNAPAGYKTEILRVYGDFIAAPKSGGFPSGTGVEVGWGLKTTAADGSKYVTYPQASATAYIQSGYDNSFVWSQDMLNAGKTAARLAFDFTLTAPIVLESDNNLISQAFVALNTSGLTIHEEPTFNVVYQFIPLN